MTIEIGSRLPGVSLMRWDGADMATEAADQLTQSGKTMIVGVVGAFTPPCSENHLKDYVSLIPSLVEAGLIQRAICIGGVDPFVIKAWGDHMGASGTIEMWSDPYLEFSRAIGITSDFTSFGLGERSGRYSMVVNASVVEKLNVEEDPNFVTVSGAMTMRDQLQAA